MSHLTLKKKILLVTSFSLTITLIVLILMPLSGVLAAPESQVLTTPPTWQKEFTPNTIGPGSVSTLTFYITNVDVDPLTDLAFTDVLPAEITIADPSSATTGCADATLIAPDGGSTITFSGGRLPSGSTCTISVNVTSSTLGLYTNLTGDLTSSAGNSGTATDDLTVAANLPGFAKSFSPSSISLGARSTLTFLIDNSANASPVSNLDFTDNLPSGMIIADPANASTDCGTDLIPPTLTAVPGATSITLDANGNFRYPALAADVTCTVVVDVTATGVGILENITGELLADFVTAGKATAALKVTRDELHFSKSFSDDPVPPGDTVTLEFKITNYNRSETASDIEFSDNLLDM